MQGYEVVPASELADGNRIIHPATSRRVFVERAVTKPWEGEAFAVEVKISESNNNLLFSPMQPVFRELEGDEK